MTDATNRKLDVENSDEGEISRDDPLFELSQIIGYSQPDGAARKDVAEGEQIDLEAELLRELENYPGYQTASDEGAVEETVPATQYDEFEAELSEEELTSADDILPEEQAYSPESTPEPEMPGAVDRTT